jgi:hypothetical protein
MWILVARDEATAMVLGFVMLPASEREDGKATHLGARQMKELAGYLLQTYPLPPYISHWVVERGTATLAEGVKAALAELFDRRIKVHYTSMIGAVSATGYAEKKKGNSRGKASHESHNRLFHTAGSFIDGQTGAHYELRPQSLPARVKECREIFAMATRLPVHLAEQARYPLPTPVKARDFFRQLAIDQNFRDQHDLEGFETVLDYWTGSAWRRIETCPVAHNTVDIRKRKEMPVERAARLMASVTGWEQADPNVIITFLSHSQRKVEVNQRGEIEFDHDGNTLIFRHAGADLALAPGTKCLAYHHEDNPAYLHLTSGDGRILGTWAQRGRTAYLDQQALAEAMRYTHAERAAALATANELAGPARERLEEMRAHNAELEKFIAVTDAPDATRNLPVGNVARGLAVASVEREAMKINPPAAEPEPDCTEELLERARKRQAEQQITQEEI